MKLEWEGCFSPGRVVEDQQDEKVRHTGSCSTSTYRQALQSAGGPVEETYFTRLILFISPA